MNRKYIGPSPEQQAKWRDEEAMEARIAELELNVSLLKEEVESLKKHDLGGERN